MSGELVLVTGGSGFVGAHAIVVLLRAGYRVRTTVRSLYREPEVRAMVSAGGAEHGERLSFVAADLTADQGWPEAVAGCEYVLHIASPFPLMQPKNEDELIVPAREGALRVLTAARDAGVKRVVLTSSFAAIGYSPKASPGPYTEENWTDPATPGISAYVKSKTIAERAAWDFIEREGGSLELSVINPVGIFGPVLARDYSSSIQLLERLMSGDLPALPKISTSLVDVRDVAELHVLAMTSPDAAGQRFLAVAGDPMTFPELAAVLRQHMGDAASSVPTRVMPDWVVRVGALFVPTLREVSRQLGQKKGASHEKATRLLGWQPRSNEESLLAAAESLVALGVVGKG